MDYTTDTSPAVEAFLTQRHAEEVNNGANQALDLAQLEFCVQLRELTGSPEDPALTSAQEQATAQIASQEQAAAQVVAAMAAIDVKPDPDALTKARVEWLRAFIPQIEAEHAQHGQLIILNEGINPVQVEASTIAQLQIEGSHKAALEELASLTGKG